MRRRLLASTLAIALVCVVILGVPLALLARHQVWTSARDRIREQAASLATGLEDRLDARQPVNLTPYLTLMPHRRIVVVAGHRQVAAAGPRFTGRTISANIAVADDQITVQASQSPTVTRARELTLIIVGLALLAAGAAVALALAQARRVARPIAQLVGRADALGRGTFTAEPLSSGIPEIDRISQVLERSARQIGTLLDLQREFASDAAHQLRTPLTSIGLHAEEISRIGDAAVQTEADELLGQVERLDRVVTTLLARARGDSADPELLDLAKLAADASGPWTRVLARDHRQFIHDAPAAVPVLARREHLLGVLTSLLDNAVVHGRGQVRLTVKTEGDIAVLSVTDDGPGVPAELRDAIFERRVSGSAGTGIGLALAHSLAAAESGTLAVDARQNSTFVLRLPLAMTPSRSPRDAR